MRRRKGEPFGSYAARSGKRLALELVIAAVGLGIALVMTQHAVEAIKQNAVKMAQQGAPSNR